MSHRPNVSTALAKADIMSCGTVTSHFSTRRRAGSDFLIRSSRSEGVRNVATAMSPLLSTISVRVRPNPEDEPVTVEG